MSQLYPAQEAMLSLLGLDPNLDTSHDVPFEDRKSIIRRGRLSLVLITTEDYGYDVAAWHNAILSTGTHYDWEHFATAMIDKHVKASTSDMVRAAIVAELEAEEQGFKRFLAGSGAEFLLQTMQKLREQNREALLQAERLAHGSLGFTNQEQKIMINHLLIIQRDMTTLIGFFRAWLKLNQP